MQAIRAYGLARFTIHLMAMDCGPPSRANCVVTSDGQACDMGASAVQAFENLHAVHGEPLVQIEVTATIGVNDVAANDFRAAAAERLARCARERGLAGAHFWALDRDAPCPRPAQGALPGCSGMEAVPALEFTRALARGLR